MILLSPINCYEKNKQGIFITFCDCWLLEQRVHDFGKENVRRLREIQRRCKEQEAGRAQSRPVPVKALWTSSKYQNATSKVMAQLEVRSVLTKDRGTWVMNIFSGWFNSASFMQVSSTTPKPQCQNFLKAHSRGGTAAPSRSESKTSLTALKRPTSCNSIDDQSLQVRPAYPLNLFT